MKTSTYERTPKAANKLGTYLDLNNKYENINKLSPENIPGIAVREIYTLRKNPAMACICSGLNTIKEVCSFRNSRVIKCPSGITAHRMASINFKKSASKARFLFTDLRMI
jgi:hypothetical protein